MGDAPAKRLVGGRFPPVLNQMCVVELPQTVAAAMQIRYNVVLVYTQSDGDGAWKS